MNTSNPGSLWEELESLEEQVDQLLYEGRDVPRQLISKIQELEDELYGDDLDDVFKLRENDG